MTPTPRRRKTWFDFENSGGSERRVTSRWQSSRWHGFTLEGKRKGKIQNSHPFTKSVPTVLTIHFVTSPDDDEEMGEMGEMLGNASRIQGLFNMFTRFHTFALGRGEATLTWLWPISWHELVRPGFIRFMESGSRPQWLGLYQLIILDQFALN